MSDFSAPMDSWDRPGFSTSAPISGLQEPLPGTGHLCEPQTTRCGFVAVLGEANAGKSTLVNALTGQKVSIVSPKAHTTRQGIYGIVCQEDTQMILVDTPGLIPQPRGALQSFMAKATSKSMREADVALVVLDATRPVPESTRQLLDKMTHKPLMVVLNKVDKVHKDVLLPLAEMASQWSPQIFMVSALRQRGIDDVGVALRQALPAGPWLFDQEDMTQISSRVWAAEMVREKVFMAVHHEVPYHTHVVTTDWKERRDEIRIDATIFVSQDRYRKWILGFQGVRIKRIGHQARLEMMDHLGKTVHLFLRVEVDPSWFSSLTP